MKFLMLLIATTFAGTTSFAASTVDLKASKVEWVGKKKTGSSHVGTIGLKQAKIGKDGKSGEFVIDINSLNVTDLEGEWKKKFEEHMKSADFFETKKFPTAKLVIDSVKGTKATGKLTIKGKTQPITIDFKKSGKSYTGKVSVDRTKFGLVYGSKNFFKKLTADKIIDDKFDITFTVVTK